MRFTPIFATSWYPDLNPFGAPTIVAMTIVAGLAFVTSGLVSLSPRVQRWLVFAFQPLFLGISSVSVGSPVFYLWWHRRSFPDLDDFLAAWIYLAVGLVCGVRCLSYPELSLRVLGVLLSFVFGAVIVADLMVNIEGFSSMWLGRWSYDWSPVHYSRIVVALGIFAVAWTIFIWFRLCTRPKKMDSENAA